jgi:hypothetical protein
MTALTLHDDFLAMRARFHRALAISVGVHALLALGACCWRTRHVPTCRASSR